MKGEKEVRYDPKRGRSFFGACIGKAGDLGIQRNVNDFLSTWQNRVMAEGLKPNNMRWV